jgi:hypothetical protein
VRVQIFDHVQLAIGADHLEGERASPVRIALQGAHDLCLQAMVIAIVVVLADQHEIGCPEGIEQVGLADRSAVGNAIDLAGQRMGRTAALPPALRRGRAGRKGEDQGDGPRPARAAGQG